MCAIRTKSPLRTWTVRLRSAMAHQLASPPEGFERSVRLCRLVCVMLVAGKPEIRRTPLHLSVDVFLREANECI